MIKFSGVGVSLGSIEEDNTQLEKKFGWEQGKISLKTGINKRFISSESETTEVLGSKAVKKRNFISPQWLRNIKGKNYPKWRIDILFSKKKYSNLYFVKDGGWHFTCLRTAEELEKKLLNFAHHYEYEESGLNIENLRKLIAEKRVMYDHNVDSKGYKWSGKSTLKNIDVNQLPDYISENLSKYPL